MITHLKVDGFRSLSHFEMTVNPGLNILVGPNGSGKTNIVSFLQFISYTASYPLADAVTKAGGAGSVFQKVGDREYRTSLTASIEGFYTYDPDRYYFRQPPASRRPRSSQATMRYRYSFEISTSPDLDVVIYQSQTLTAWKTFPNRKSAAASLEPDFRINLGVSADGVPTVTLDRFELDKFDLRLHFDLGKTRTPRRKQVDALFKNYFGTAGVLDEPIFQRLTSIIQDFRYLRPDFTGGEIFNIIPSRVRFPEDSASPPFIQSDGSGLAATLYALQKNTGRFVSRSPFGVMHRNLPPATFPQIIKYMQTVNESISSLSVTNDPFDNRLKVAVRILGEKGEMDLPFSSMSDGTVKWASLITCILTYETIFAIEEPENFLHPLMQREILTIMRENVQRRGGQSFVIMTTHSETLLNAAEPTEVVVVSNSNGITHSERPGEPERIRAEIQRTGFGLGYYYVSGALDDA
jgi:energy-coupling factor transporter ATP-binding protein EcfA2